MTQITEDQKKQIRKEAEEFAVVACGYSCDDCPRDMTGCTNDCPWRKWNPIDDVCEAYMTAAQKYLSLSREKELEDAFKEALNHIKSYRIALTQNGNHSKAGQISDFIDRVYQLLNPTEDGK